MRSFSNRRYSKKNNRNKNNKRTKRNQKGGDVQALIRKLNMQSNANQNNRKPTKKKLRDLNNTSYKRVNNLTNNERKKAKARFKTEVINKTVEEQQRRSRLRSKLIPLCRKERFLANANSNHTWHNNIVAAAEAHSDNKMTPDQYCERILLDNFEAVAGRNRTNKKYLGENGNNEHFEGDNSFEQFMAAHGNNTVAAYTQGTQSSNSLKRVKNKQIQPANRENVYLRETQRRNNGSVSNSWRNNVAKARSGAQALSKISNRELNSMLKAAIS